METKDILRKVIEIQIEQNELALKISYEEVRIQYLSESKISQYLPDFKEINEKSLRKHKEIFHDNQEKLRKLLFNLCLMAA